MPFSRRYLLWLLLPPLPLLALSFLFLAQVLQLSSSEWLALVAIGALTCAMGWTIYIALLWPVLRELENARSDEALSHALSRCLERTSRAAILSWLGGGGTFAILGAWLTVQSVLGFSYFLVAALIGALPSIVWGYAAAKRLLSDRAQSAGDIRYYGREFSLGKKMGLVFIGLFIVSAIAIIQLISARVSTTLEKLAIASISDRFNVAHDVAAVSAMSDAELLKTINNYIPEDYGFYLIKPNGQALSSRQKGLPIDDNDIEQMRRIRSGDSSTYMGPNVLQFRELKDGSILALAIPFRKFESIPYQIAYYTLIIALITTVIFSAATFFLSRDIAWPIRELRKLAGEMARGNFDSDTRIFSDDEIGALAASFRETKSNLRSLISRIGGSGATITQNVRVITGGTESLLVRSQEQATLTANSSAALANVRAGAQSVLDSAEKVTDLAQDASSRATELQASAEEVARSMDYLSQSVEKTSASTTEMDASAREMSDRTEVLANIGEEVLSFVTEMDATIDELRRSAQVTADLSRQVREDATGGAAAADETLNGIKVTRDTTLRAAKVMDELQRSIGQISQILSVIEEITDRTNLLSLNAAIIAAQAGEQGAGFTVVADEIRELAERTRGSTKEIAGIIKAVQRGSKEAVAAIHEGVDRVNQNVSLAQNAAASLSKIESSAAQSYDMANSISASLSEQTQASRHLHQVTSKMSDHIAEINRATREQARGTMMMAEEAERVREIAFQVKNSTDQQSYAAGGITQAMEQVASDIRMIRDLLESQLTETERIASASDKMLTIARSNDAVAQEFNETVQNLLQSGQEFENAVSKFHLTEH